MLAMAVFSRVALYTGVSRQDCLLFQGQPKPLSSAETESYLTQVVTGQTALTLAIFYRLEKSHSPTCIYCMALELCLPSVVLSFLICRMGVVSTIVVHCKVRGSICKVNGTQTMGATIMESPNTTTRSEFYPQLLEWGWCPDLGVQK